MLKAIIFDMDGVLVDSSSAIEKSFKIILGRFGVDYNLIDRKKYSGMSLRDQLEGWKEEFPQIPKDFSYLDFAQESTVREFELLSEELKPKAEIIDLINEAKVKGIKIAVATSSTKYRAELFLKTNGVYELLDAFIASDDVKRHKPEPDLFLEAARRAKVSTSCSVVIEDATSGITAALRANMKAVAKLTSHYSKADFSNANLIFEDFAKLRLRDLENLF